jgi:hypothetical protein
MNNRCLPQRLRVGCPLPHPGAAPVSVPPETGAPIPPT